MPNPLVSIVVPVYNAAFTLSKCVDSLTSQTFKNVEILLINNGSTDDSWSVCLDLASKDSRIKAINHSEKGVSSARNQGILASTGEYVLFVDADDWIDDDVCEIFANENRLHNYDLFCFSAQYHKACRFLRSYLFAENVALLSESQKEELQIKVLAPNAPHFKYKTNTRFAGSAWGKFYKREILQKNNLRFATETIISEDVLFNTLSLDYFHRIGYTKQCFYHYEQSEDSAQNRYRPNSDKYFMFVIERIQEWLLNTGKDQRFVDAANCLFVHYLFGVLKEDLFHKDNKRSYTEKSNKLKKILSDDIWNNIVEMVKENYFSTPEKMLIWLLNHKWCSIVSLLMRIYC